MPHPSAQHLLRELAACLLLQRQQRCWLPEVSSRIPSVRGRPVSATKLLSVCGTLSSTPSILLGQMRNDVAVLVLTVKNMSTRFTVC